jgi:hypothetical protein
VIKRKKENNMPESPVTTETTGQPEGGHPAAAGEQKVASKVFSVIKMLK